jgi:hypothetical protein
MGAIHRDVPEFAAHGPIGNPSATTVDAAPGISPGAMS